MNDSDDKQIKNIFSKLPVPDASSKFVNSLGNELSLMGEVKYKKLQKTKSVDMFGTWKLSLGVISLLFFMIIGTLLYSSESINKKFSEYANQKAQSANAEEVTVRVLNVEEYIQMNFDLSESDEQEANFPVEPIEAYLFVYQDKNGDVPLLINGYLQSNRFVFKVNPGKYNLVVVSEIHGVIWEQELVVFEGQSDVIYDLLQQD